MAFVAEWKIMYSSTKITKNTTGRMTFNVTVRARRIDIAEFMEV